jgi:GNAT superfamily N-acetyltransferase
LNTDILPQGFNLRPAAWSDLQAVTGLIYAACAADGDATMAVSSEELAQEWKTPGFNLENDAWVVTDPAGKVIGFEEFANCYSHASLQGDGYVHPDYINLGVGTSLLGRLDARARQEVPLAPPGLRVFIRNGAGVNEKNARVIHEEAGFTPIRFSWRMEISLDSHPDTACWPVNIELRPFDLASQDHILYLAHQDAFRDHWGHTPRPYEFWQTNVSGHPDFDTDQWYLAWDADQIAGYSLCRSRQGLGWVGTLGVRRPWRKQGLGMALLKHSFQELYRRGYSTIGLTVDASNPTGATRLYERAGMHVASQFIVYEKEYRPGLEPEE